MFIFCVLQTLWLLVLLCNIPNYLGHGVMDEVPGVSYCYHKEIHAGTVQEITLNSEILDSDL